MSYHIKKASAIDGSDVYYGENDRWTNYFPKRKVIPTYFQAEQILSEKVVFYNIQLTICISIWACKSNE